MTRFALILVLTMATCAPGLTAPTAGHWFTGVTDKNSALYAVTSNDDGFIFGKYCFFSSKTCSWHVALDMGCDVNATYPVLASTEKGASTFSLKCMGKLDDSHYEYVFTDWKELERLVDKGVRLGIVTPMESDQFRVYRFLLDGLPQMTKEVEKDFFDSLGPKNSSNTKMTNTASETL